MSSLLQQLQARKEAQAKGASASSRERASLLFEPKEALELDSHTILVLGEDGLAQLTQQDPRFDAYRSKLFNPVCLIWINPSNNHVERRHFFQRITAP